MVTPFDEEVHIQLEADVVCDINKSLAEKRLAEKHKIEEKEENFDVNMEKLSKPEITANEEKAVLFQLIKDKRSDLVRQLIIEMNVKEIVGKSKIFKVLSEAFSNNIGKKSEKPVEERKRKLPDSWREDEDEREKNFEEAQERLEGLRVKA